MLIYFLVFCVTFRRTAPTSCGCCSRSIRLMFMLVVPELSIHSALTCTWDTTQRWTHLNTPESTCWVYRCSLIQAQISMFVGAFYSCSCRLLWRQTQIFSMQLQWSSGLNILCGVSHLDSVSRSLYSCCCPLTVNNHRRRDPSERVDAGSVSSPSCGWRFCVCVWSLSCRSRPSCCLLSWSRAEENVPSVRGSPSPLGWLVGPHIMFCVSTHTHTHTHKWCIKSSSFMLWWQ